ncbi:MAG: AMP-binding protein [Acidiferrobacterales bacterium]|nr:AMP-binding protein [Acidiferrobacterales bacterium]
MNNPAPDALDTFPKLLIDNARRIGDRPAVREKEYGIWQSWTWSEVKTNIFEFAAGLHTLGFSPGDKIAIVGRNRPRLYWTITAAQCLGGIPVPVYSDSVAEEMEYVLDHAEVRFVLAEDQEQVDKVMEVSERLPKLDQIIYDDVRGLRDYDKTQLHDFTDVQKLGREALTENPALLDAQIAAGSGSDIGIFLYTSGTTGKPKGVVLTNDNIIVTSRNSVKVDELTEQEEVLSYLPLAWVGDHIFSHGQAYVAGFCINCPESEETVTTDLREIGPTYYFAPPRVFEGILTHVTIRMEDASPLKQKLFHFFMDVARKVGVKILNGQSVPALDRFKYWLGNLLIYAPLKNTMGFSRIKLAYTAGEAIGPEIFDFYRSLGINIKQLYGQTEAAVFITMQPNGEVFADTVGVPAPEVEIKITDGGEVIYRSPGVFHSYYKNEEATRETKNADGWVMTGDAGYFDDNGHLKIIDRAKDVGRLNDGSMFAPKYLENKLKFFSQIKEVVTFGDQRDFVTAFINIDLDAVGNWAERNNIPYASYLELAAHPEVYKMMAENIEQTNADLATDSKMAGSQIHRFLILHKELDPDDGEMTRTRKVRRTVIFDRYDVLINALYDGSKSAHIKTEVTFEDGRTGAIEADVSILDVKTFPAVSKSA